MQKKLIALAVAGLVSAPVFAQSNVTVYGVADAGIAYGEHGEGEFQGVLSGVLSGSRIGFKGSEDLGNGLKAVFQLEQGFDIGDGGSSPSTRRGDSVFSRQAWVGVSGAWGTVGLGRQYAPGYFANYDAVLGANISPQSLLSNQTGASITPNSAARWDNSVSYTGSFSGLTARAIYAANAETNAFNPATGQEVFSADDDDAFGLGLDYSNGPLKVGAVYHLLSDAVSTAGSDDQQEWLLGASYDFGVLTLAGSYQQTQNALFIDGADVDIYQLGVIVPVGAAGNVHVAYGEADIDAPGFDGKTKAYTVAYTHALSKRTTAYAGYMGTDNDDGLAISLVDPGFKSVGGVGVEESGEKSHLVAVGLRHTF
ncbi:porin [Thauera phenolivorans]|uniref:porin n=1 Tax=Thauera phenolivorans TaxID=1792543 RepID=UPI00083A523B|nr:porin [Thauera phenolivorans]